MTAKRVDLCVWENGVRKVVGFAHVDVGNDYVDVTGTVTDEKYIKKLLDDSGYSLGPFTAPPTSNKENQDGTTDT